MKILKTISIFVVAALLFGAATTVNAQKNRREPCTVVDFYLLLPAEYLSPLSRVKNRQSLIEIKDIANGYLKLDGAATTDYWEGWAEIALFKKTGGGYVVGVVDGSCATMCYSGIEFLEYQNGKWTEVTRQIMPEITDRMIAAQFKRKKRAGDEDLADNDSPFVNYELPRTGKTVKLNANFAGDDNLMLFEMTWTGAKFELKQ